MAQIELIGRRHKGYFATVDDCDYEELMKYKWHKHSEGYASRSETINGKTKLILMHRHILGCDSGMQIDHKNYNRLDNRRENLRVATHQQNTWNHKVRVYSHSPYKGIAIVGGKFIAQIVVGRKNKKIGSFDFLEDAINKYNEEAVRLRGEFAYINKYDAENKFYVDYVKNMSLAIMRRKIDKKASSKYIGVSVASRLRNGVKYKYYLAQMVINGKHIYLGTFDDEIEAGMAYNRYVEKNCGELTPRNYFDVLT